MASKSEHSLQYERDFRTPQQEQKRYRDHKAKWVKAWPLNGEEHYRPIPGVFYRSSYPFDLIHGDLEQAECKKVRPCKPLNRAQDPWSYAKDHNAVKGRARNLNGHGQHKIAARLEAQDATSQDSPSFPRQAASRQFSPRAASDGVLYSYDDTDSPAAELSLDAFIKPNTRETEKLVEKEYEVLGEDGEALRGKKARRHLRKAASASPSALGQAKAAEAAALPLEDDGFELV